MLNILAYISMGTLYVFLGEVSVQVLCSFLIGLFAFLVLSCMSSLYILEIKPLSNVSFDPVIPLLGIYSKNPRTPIQKCL